MSPAELLARFQPQPGPTLDHDRQLWQARFSPCGRFLAAGGYDSLVHRWDVSGESPQPLPPLGGYHAWVQRIEFVGERLLAADSWGRLAAWKYDQPDAAPLWAHEAAHDGWIRALAVSPDGQLVATGGNDRVVRLWQAADGAAAGELPHPERVFGLAFHPASGRLVSGDLRGVVREWDLGEKQIVRELDASPLAKIDKIQDCGGARELAFSPDGRWLGVGGQLEPGGGFATGTPGILVFHWETGELVRKMAVGGQNDGFCYDVRFHPAGFVMGCSGAFPNTGHVWFWRPEDEKPFYESKDIPNGRTLSLHPDGRRLALLVSLAANGNGRQLNNGVYEGGTGKVHLLQLPEGA